MKVFHLITGLTIGGAEKMLLLTLPKLAEQQMVCSIIPRQKIGEELEALGTAVHYLNLRSLFDIRAPYKLWRLLRRERPDILVTYLLHADIMGRIIGRLASVPVIVSSLRCAHKDKPWLVKLSRWTVPLAHHFVAVSSSVQRWAEQQLRVPADKITVIHNGLVVPTLPTNVMKQQLKQRLQLPADHDIVTYVGRLDPQKGLEYLLTALALLPETIHQQLTVLLVGDGPSRASLQQQANNVGLGSLVHFLGFRRDVTDLLAVTDIFVSPTMFEGISNAIMEAMSLAKPVITTDIPENRELIDSNQNGILVQVCNSTALAQHIESLLQHPIERDRLGQNARATMLRQFSLEYTLERLNQLFRELYVRHRR